jgi:hypothetical protein
LRARGMRRCQMCTEERVALTKMTDDNFAMVFAPNLLSCPSQVTSLTSLPSPPTPLPLPSPSPVSVALPAAVPLCSMLVRQFSTRPSPVSQLHPSAFILSSRPQNPIVAFNNAKLEKVFVKHLIQHAALVDADAGLECVRQALSELPPCTAPMSSSTTAPAASALPTPSAAPASAPSAAVTAAASLLVPRPSLVRPAAPTEWDPVQADSFARCEELAIAPAEGVIGVFQTGVRRTSEGGAGGLRRGSGAGGEPRAQNARGSPPGPSSAVT